jgi:electron transfer flavoprotein alpha subunit
VENAVWVVAERVGPSLRRATFELLGKARELVEHTRSEVAAVLVGDGNEEDVKALAAYGADKVLLMNGPSFGHPTSIACTSALARAIASANPYAVLFPSTPNGRDLASRVAARLSLGLTGDCVDLEINEGGELVQLKPALGGNVVAPILSKTRPYMATLRPGLLTPVEPDWGLDAEVGTVAAPGAGGPDIEMLDVYVQEDAGGLALEAARTVMAVGMGIGGPENLPTVYRLAESIGATVAATRNVTDAGWLPRQIQVGLTGRAIAPKLYIAVGIRGDFNHTVGIQKAGTILAINNNPNPRRSPILQAADFSIIGDWETYLPPMIEALKPWLESS